MAALIEKTNGTIIPTGVKWNLVKDITEYVHSSARFYLCEEQDAYPVTNYFELDDIDLTKPVPD